MPGHDRELCCQVNVDRFLEHVTDHVFHHVANFEFVQEGRFDIDLREFRLAVGTQVFVTEALDDLVVTVEASHHQQLLKQLRRLRQSIEVTVVNAARNQVVTSAFRGATRQHRRFDVDEAHTVQVVTDCQSNLVTQLQILLHLQTTQVENAIRQARRFGQVFVVEVERGRFRLVEDLHFVAKHFHAARDQVCIIGAFRTCTDETDNLQAIFITNRVCRCKHFRTVRVTNHLHETFTVTQVDKDHAAVVTTTVCPTKQSNRLTNERLIDKTGIFGTHKSSRQ